VKEEVTLGKNVGERTEKISDTVHRTESRSRTYAGMSSAAEPLETRHFPHSGYTGRSREHHAASSPASGV
jgi:hypothetical protein